MDTMRQVAAIGLGAAIVAGAGGGYALSARPQPPVARSTTPASVTPLLGPGRLAAAVDCEQGNAMARSPVTCAEFQVPRAVLGESRAALALAYAFTDRVRLAARATHRNPRELALIRAAAGGLRLSALTDVDRNGVDDDGLVELALPGRVACVALPVTASYATRVFDGACAATAEDPSSSDYTPKKFPDSYSRTQ